MIHGMLEMLEIPARKNLIKMQCPEMREPLMGNCFPEDVNHGKVWLLALGMS